MAGLMSVGGLVSGMDTSSIVSQLIAIEGNKQTLLKTRLAAVNNTKSSLQTINVQMAALATAAKSLSGATGWTTRAITSTSANVSASATTSAAPGAYGFTIASTATAHRLVFANTANSTDQVMPNGDTLVFTAADGAVQEITVTDGTLAGVVKAINDSEVKVTASVVTLSDGTQRLSVAATATGAASAFTLQAKDGSGTLTDILGGAEDPTAGGRGTVGRDAAITVDGDTITSPTNTFGSAFGGVTFTLSPKATAGETVTLDVATDSKSISASVAKMVEQVNSIIAEIATKTAYNPATKTGSALSGNGEVRQLREQLLSAVTSSAGGTSLSSVGVSVTRDGKLSFDAAKFATAFAADPAAVEKAFTATATVGTTTTPVGLAAKLTQIAERASHTETGTLVTAMKGYESTAKDLTTNIESWDRRLAVRKLALERQYTAMETALSSLQNQATWLSGQISSLNAGSSS